MTPDQFRGPPTAVGPTTVFCAHPSSFWFPAAATITASLTVAAYQTAAAIARWSRGSAAETQAATLTLITPAPVLAACTTARARVATVPAFRCDPPSPGLTGSNAREDWRMEISVACGATPATPSGGTAGAAGSAGRGGFGGSGAGIRIPLGAAVITEATMVP